MPRFSNRPFLAMTLSFLSSRAKLCHPERSRGICGAPFVCPAPTGPNLHQSSPNPHGNTKLHFIIPGSRSGPRNRRSLGFARDDKKERVVARKGRLLNRGIFQIHPGLRPGLSSAVPAGLIVESIGSHADTLARAMSFILSK